MLAGRWCGHWLSLLPLPMSLCQSGSALTCSAMEVQNLGVGQAPTLGFRTVFPGPSKGLFGSHPKAAAVFLSGQLWSLLL